MVKEQAEKELLANEEAEEVKVKAATELANQQEADRLAKVKAEEQAQLEAIAQEKKVEEERLVKEQEEKELLAKKEAERITKEQAEEKPSPIASKTKYTVQLLSLSRFSEERLGIFCKKHKLPVNSVKKRQVGSLMKITYGEANTIKEANLIQEKLIRDNNINQSFVTYLK